MTTMNTPNVLSLSPFEFRECLAIVACMGEQEFMGIFGSADYRVHGYNCYQWEKFANEYRKDVAKWICYLDGGNLTLIVEYLKKRLDENRNRKG